MASTESGVKKNRVSLNLTQKLKLIEKLEQGVSVPRVCQIYGVKRRTVSDIRKSKAKLEQFSLEYSAISTECGSAVGSKKHMKGAQHKHLEEAVFKWYVKQKSSGVYIRSLNLKSAYETIGKSMGLVVKASDGWLWRFKKRRGIELQKYGEQMWTSEDITSLISLVQIHSTLYDTSDPDYSNTEIVNTTWQQIGIKLKRTSESCSNKWRELQTEYQKRNNNLKFNSNHKNKDWIYFDSLDFLKQYLQDTVYNESSLANNLNPFLFVSANSQSSEVSQNVSTGDRFNESSSSASTDSVSIKSEIEVEDNFVEIQNHNGNDISNEMESDSKLNQDLVNTIDNDYSLNEMESDFATNDLNLETNVDGTNKSMKLFLLSLLEDASHLSKPAQREFKLKTLALLHNLQ